MRDNKTKMLVIVGLFAALTTIATMVIKVPTIATNGYTHIGDTMVYLCGAILGPIVGGLAAAIGSALADLFLGYPVYIAPTFVIKGLDAFVVGLIFKKTIQSDAPLVKKLVTLIVGILFGGAIMVGGYFLFGSYMYGVEGAVTSVVPNIGQAAVGGILAIPLFVALDKAKIRNYM